MPNILFSMIKYSHSNSIEKIQLQIQFLEIDFYFYLFESQIGDY